MTTTLVASPPEVVSGRGMLAVLAVREARRFVLNPFFLIAVAIVTPLAWATPNTNPAEIDAVASWPGAFPGGLAMLATFWLTRSMHASEPIVDVAPVPQTTRTAALCTVALVPFAWGGVTLLLFLHVYPITGPAYGAFSQSARLAILVGQIVVPTLGGPLLGVALGRWVRFPGAGFVLFLGLFGWLQLVTFPSLSHPDFTPLVVLRLFSPFAFFTVHVDAAGPITSWRGSPWFFLGWQLALCAIAVLVALLRGTEGQTRRRIVRALGIVAAAAAILLVLAALGGFPHPVVA
jgi:hypothetical protein